MFSRVILFILQALLVLTHTTSGSLTTINGTLVEIVDNCTPGDDSTCPTGKCCVKKGLGYLPEYTGPKPTYQIACKPFRQQGEFCYHRNVSTILHEVCPCAPTLNCESHGIFGQCH
ncbi:venom protein 164-like [Ruditapes philippinarum]|uniref:venom protein 164-like n=1 Tax=Ruditapes philippinarum TaxID=129788 RepID=UPI00295B38AE|nr:venom protein 164-like [Ruditapes philippinarum]